MTLCAVIRRCRRRPIFFPSLLGAILTRSVEHVLGVDDPIAAFRQGWVGSIACIVLGRMLYRILCAHRVPATIVQTAGVQLTLQSHCDDIIPMLSFLAWHFRSLLASCEEA